MLFFIKFLRGYFRRMFHGFDLHFLNEIRARELKIIQSYLPKGKEIKILEVGGGTGKQAMLLREKGYDVHSIDLENSNYSQLKNDIVTIYDGITIPLTIIVLHVLLSSPLPLHAALEGAKMREQLSISIINGSPAM